MKDEELFELDLDAEIERTPRAARIRQGTLSDDWNADVRRTVVACERAIGRARLLINYNVLGYEEMNLVFRMEEYFNRNKHLGLHWLKQLQRLNHKYAGCLAEAQVSANLID